MTELRLMVGASYQTREGDVITINRDIRTEHGHIGKDRLAAAHGYVFVADNGDTYLPNGRFDIEEETSLDLVEIVNKQYLVSVSIGKPFKDNSLIVTASDPQMALNVFVHHCGRIEPNVISTKVYELKDVTPKEINT